MIYLKIQPFFLQNEKYVTEVLNNFNIMSQFSGLKINKSNISFTAELRHLTFSMVEQLKLRLAGIGFILFHTYLLF